MADVDEGWETQLKQVQDLASDIPLGLLSQNLLEALQAVLAQLAAHENTIRIAAMGDPKVMSPGYMAARQWASGQGHRLIVASKLADFGDGSMTYLATIVADEKLVCYRLVLAKRDLNNGTYPRLRVVTVCAPEPDDCMCAQESEYDRLCIAVLGCPSHGDTAAVVCPHPASAMQVQDDGLKLHCNDCGATWARA